MAQYIYSDQQITIPDDIKKDLRYQILSNRVMVYSLLQNAGLSPRKTFDKIYADVFTDASGWRDTIDTAGTDAIYDPTNRLYANYYKGLITDTPNAPEKSYEEGIGNSFSFYVYYTGDKEQWRITKVRLNKYTNQSGSVNVYIKRADTSEQVGSGSSYQSFESNETYTIDISGDYVPKDVGLVVEVDSTVNWWTNGGFFDATVNNVRIYSDGADPNRVPARNEGYPTYDIVEVEEYTPPYTGYIKTKTFSLPSPIKQLLVFADRELVNSPGEMEVEVYDTSDTLLASGEIMELIDISNYNVSSVYLKLKLKGSGDAYTKCYGYSVAFIL